MGLFPGHRRGTAADLRSLSAHLPPARGRVLGCCGSTRPKLRRLLIGPAFHFTRAPWPNCWPPSPRHTWRRMEPGPVLCLDGFFRLDFIERRMRKRPQRAAVGGVNSWSKKPARGGPHRRAPGEDPNCDRHPGHPKPQCTCSPVTRLLPPH